MAKNGGAREGAGRKPGAMNRRSSDVLAELTASGQSPAEYLFGIFRDENADPKDRAWAANAAAPYVHPRLAPVQQRIAIALPDTSTAAGVRDAIAVVVQAVSSGEMAPAEGQSLMAIIDAQRKAIETADILERLEKLEDAAERR